MPPTVSVVLAVYNGEEYLREAIQSIIDQSFRDFEFIIVSEHGTSAASLDIIGSFDDPRIIHVHNTEKLGLVRSLNLGISMAKGRYIARMDGDDVCARSRFEEQVRFLDSHPGIAAVGGDAVLIDEHGGEIVAARYPHRPAVVRWEMFFRSAIANSSAMLRAEAVRKAGGYDEGTPLAEDYSLWLRLLQTSELANLPDALLMYRVHEQSTSTVGHERINSIADRLSREAIAELMGGEPSEEAVACLRDRSQIRSQAQGESASHLLASMHRRYVQRQRPSWSDRVRTHTVTLRLQMAISMRFVRSDTMGALSAMGQCILLSPSTGLPALLSATGQLIAYRRKMRKLGALPRNHHPAR